MTDLKNDRILEINQFEKLMNFQNLTLKNKKKLNVTIWKINILQFAKLLNCANNLWIMKNKFNNKTIE